MFKRGDIIIVGNDILLVVLDPRTCIVLYSMGVFRPDDDDSVKWTIQPSDRLATVKEMDALLKGRPLPQWVKDIQNEGMGIPCPSGPTVSQPGLDHVAAAMNIKPHQEPVIEFKPLAALETFREQCNHKWQTYTGFTKVFDFCVHCDKRK